MQEKEKTESRRDFLKKGVYAAPAILTLSATPSFAGIGSGPMSSSSDDDDQGEDNDFQ